ncbi:NADPH:quinone reductase [Candidatus Kaiserbacteria bacterium CG10_big_fil_rev_8_21_14_0_10_51_14]|uniref:NADPH:quinone reductase n=1 Tax=Candidatus Kaiserbacteria bacterium CG10_big_fil_rev_8_21_14_0_10_51_14 TaxID=1974610 RepID=A0A2H0UCE9_9BACT|nr:MAG: NADPH:quinone reductase [Candidatus Kaiserbacteria bacterium CG10_big_fil_rev_8_21_14_0_10_51_14]
MKSKKILVLLGHPDKSGFCGEMTDAYCEAARAVGHAVDRMNIGEMQFDPTLWKGYRERQTCEPDLCKFQDLLTAADHFVIIYPVWWVGMPALLKGLFDRAWLPGSAFRYIKTKTGKRTIFWHRLFRGKTARILMASGTAPWLVRFLPGNVNAQLKWGILWFAGFSVRTRWFGPSENIPEARKARWLAEVRELGRLGK